MRKRLLLFCMIIFVVGLCTGCKPQQYSQEHKQEIENAHSGEANTWFATNMPGANVLTTEAYGNGVDLYSIIYGKYSTTNGDFEFYYDYDSDTMYLGEDYEEAVEVANQELAAALGISEEQILLQPHGWRINVASENDKFQHTHSNAGAGKVQITLRNVLPAGADPNEVGRKMIYEGLPDGGGSSPSQCVADIYIDSVPDYDHDLFVKLAGVNYIQYIQPADLCYDGIYGASYSQEKSELRYLHLEDGGSGRSVGYTYTITDEFFEDGTLSRHEDPGENGLDDMNVQINGSSVSFHIPNGTEPIVIATLGHYYFDTTDANGNPKAIEWYQEMSEANADYLQGANLSYFRTMAFPKGGNCLYRITKGDHTEFNFR